MKESKELSVGDLVRAEGDFGPLFGRVVENLGKFVRVEDRTSLHVPLILASGLTRVSQAEVDLAELKQQVADLACYLQSSKFVKDPTVQVNDVLTRLGLR